MVYRYFPDFRVRSQIKQIKLDNVRLHVRARAQKFQVCLKGDWLAWMGYMHGSVYKFSLMLVFPSGRAFLLTIHMDVDELVDQVLRKVPKCVL